MKPVVVRPYQLMCIVCRQAAGFDGDPRDAKLKAMLAAIRKKPERPVSLCCNVDTTYDFQNPGIEDDTPEGDLYNVKRDLDILQRLGLAPGATHPARDLFFRLLKKITSARGICGYGNTDADPWKGCAFAGSGNYEKGVAAGVAAIIPPRDQKQKERAKKKSVRAMYEAATLDIRPHHFMCMTCFHGGQEKISPIAVDNLFEAIDIIRKNPEIPVRLVKACTCMICPPCHSWNPKISKCVSTCSLRDQKKDLDVLQKTGLKFGDVLPAREFLNKLYAAISSTKEICGCGDGVATSFEWDGCGMQGNEGYVKGRAAGMGVPGVTVE